MPETTIAPPKDAESYALEGEEDETEVRFCVWRSPPNHLIPCPLLCFENVGDQADEAASSGDGT